MGAAVPHSRFSLPRFRSLRIVRVAAVALAVGVLSLPLLSTPAVAETTTQRSCEYFSTGDDIRELSICVSMWESGIPGQARVKIDMHTYRFANGVKLDSVSQSISLNAGYIQPGGTDPTVPFGTKSGTDTCRLGSPSGAVSSCSVANAASVTFYSKAVTAKSFGYTGCVIEASWRDDLGQAHFLDQNHPSHPDTMGVCKSLNH
jgi:hypothetical protein